MVVKGAASGGPPMTVYSKPDDCMQCKMTYRALARQGLVEGVHYSTIDITDPANADHLAYITEDLGYAQAPVVVIDATQHWSGFRPDQIKRSAPWVRERAGTPVQVTPDARERCRAMSEQLDRDAPAAERLPPSMRASNHVLRM